MSARQGIDSPTRRTSPWPRYDAAATGLRNYWYPVAWSRSIGDRPVAIRLLDEPIALLRENGRVRALADRCPHRAIPLSVGRREFPGTWTCRYHGWTFDVETGVLKAALTDGPDSPICGKVRVRTYPVEDRAGLIWVYVGDEPPPPVEADIPEELLHPDAAIVGRITVRRGNWRYACENGFDEGHAMFLHRYGALLTAFERMPAWLHVDAVVDEDGWLRHPLRGKGMEGDYPGLGHWPPRPVWKRPRWYVVDIAGRLPGVMRLTRSNNPQIHFIWWTPVDRDHYRMLQFYVKQTRGVGAVAFRLAYLLYWKPLHHIQFNGQDAWMVELMPETAPERLYRPDVSITSWRKLCEQARGQQQ